MDRTWKSICHTAIVGTDRNPISEADLHTLGISPSDDPAQTALRALSAAKWLRQAAAPLASGSVELPKPGPQDDRPICHVQAALPLKSMLLDAVFTEAIPEYFDCLEKSGFRLPPEYLPIILNWAERQRKLPEMLERALGPIGKWLAQQQPDWSALFPEEQSDWATGRFSERLQLLQEARHTRPKVGMAWLEKTWPQERAEHRLRFLETFRIGLSPADAPLLERALADKSRPVRFTACRLLLLLPKSSLRQNLQNWLQSHRKKLSKTKYLPAVLETLLPEEGPFSKMHLLALAPDKTVDPMAVLFKLMPSEDLALAAGLEPPELLEAVFSEKTTAEMPEAALLDNIAWRRQKDWSQATARYFRQSPQHLLWTSEALAEVLNDLPDLDWSENMTALAGQYQLLELEYSAFVRALLHSEQAWPGNLVQAILQYPLRSDRPRHWAPPQHFRKLLERAAYRCQPADTDTLQHSERNWPYAWHSELVQFRAIVEFRRHIRRAFKLQIA